MRFRMTALIGLLVFLVSSFVSADDGGRRFKKSAFTHHIGIMNVMASDDPRFMDVDYHFTTLRMGRFRFAGGGIGLDVFSGSDSEGDWTYLSPYLTATLVNVALNEGPEPGKPFWSLGVGYGYTLKSKDHGFMVGISRSWGQKPKRRRRH